MKLITKFFFFVCMPCVALLSSFLPLNSCVCWCQKHDFVLIPCLAFTWPCMGTLGMHTNLIAPTQPSWLTGGCKPNIYLSSYWSCFVSTDVAYMPVWCFVSTDDFCMPVYCSVSADDFCMPVSCLVSVGDFCTLFIVNVLCTFLQILKGGCRKSVLGVCPLP